MPSAVRRAGCALISTLAVLAIAAPAAMAVPEGKAIAVSSLANGAKPIKYRIGPFNIVPGQNESATRSSARSRGRTGTSPASVPTSPTSTGAFPVSTSGGKLLQSSP